MVIYATALFAQREETVTVFDNMVWNKYNDLWIFAISCCVCDKQLEVKWPMEPENYDWLYFTDDLVYCDECRKGRGNE